MREDEHVTPEAIAQQLLAENKQLRIYAAQKAADAMLSEITVRDLTRAAEKFMREPFSKTCARELQRQLRRAADRREVSGAGLLVAIEAVLDCENYDDARDYASRMYDLVDEVRAIVRPTSSQLPAPQGQPSTTAPGDESNPTAK